MGIEGFFLDCADVAYELYVPQGWQAAVAQGRVEVLLPPGDRLLWEGKRSQKPDLEDLQLAFNSPWGCLGFYGGLAAFISYLILWRVYALPIPRFAVLACCLGGCLLLVVWEISRQMRSSYAISQRCILILHHSSGMHRIQVIARHPEQIVMVQDASLSLKLPRESLELEIFPSLMLKKLTNSRLVADVLRGSPNVPPHPCSGAYRPELRGFLLEPGVNAKASREQDPQKNAATLQEMQEKLDQGNPWSCHVYAAHLAMAGKTEEALEWFGRAIGPLTRELERMAKCPEPWFVGRYFEGVEEVRQKIVSCPAYDPLRQQPGFLRLFASKPRLSSGSKVPLSP